MSGSYQVFARKYRPRTFEDILGQDHVVQTLRNAIEQDRLAHAYLFVGPRGTGKTSTARILAKALNCPGGPKADFDPGDPVCLEIADGNSLDVLEIDGASNNGVEQVRELRETVQFAPSSGQFKIYYIDEVHMLSTAAFNALLKTLEEPPPHVKFIFATTEPQKILPTIISRCQRFDLRRIPSDVIASHLLHISREEGIELSEAAAFAIAKGAEGGMRDAQSMLDQLVAFCGEKIDESNVLDIFGFNSAESVSDLAGRILSGRSGETLETIYGYSEAGKDFARLLGDLIGHFRNILVLKVDPGIDTGEMPADLLDTLREQAAAVDTPRLLRVIDLLAETDGRMKWAPNKRLHLEIGAIKAIQALGETSIDDVISLVKTAASSAESLPAGTGASAPAGGDASGPVSAPRAKDGAPRERVELKLPEPGSESEATGAPAAETKAEAAPATKPSAAPDAGPAADPTPAVSTESSPQSPAEQSPTEEFATEPPSSGESSTGPSAAGAEASPAPVSGEILSGEPLWFAARDAMIEVRPLFEAWLKAAHFLSHEGDTLQIGFSAEQSFFRDSLSRYESEMAEELSKKAGQAIRLSVVVRDDLSPIEMEIEEAPPPAEPAAAAEPEPTSEKPAEAAAEPAESGDSFQDDPLIREALETFEARVIKS